MTVSIEGTTPGIAVDGTGAVVNVTVTTGAGGGGGGVALGETSTTAYRGDRGKTAYDHSQVTTGNPHGTTAADVGADPAGTAAGLVDDLSGVSNQATARTNLGLGTAATAATGDFAAASHTHTGTQVTVDASGFNGNLTTSDDTVQEVAQKLDDLVIPAAGIADPGGSNDDFLQRKSGAWTNRTVAQVKSDLGVGAPAPIAHFYEDDIYSGLQGLSHATVGGGGTGVLYGANLLYLWRIMSPQDVTIDGLLFQVQVDGGSGALARCGIYAQDATTAPVGAPLVQSADLNVNVAGGTLVSASLTPTALSAWTPYWSAMVLNSGTSQIRYMASGASNTTRVNNLDAGQSSGSTYHTLRCVAHTFGALPTNPAASFTIAVKDIPGVLWKVQV